MYERPREKLTRAGVTALNNVELLQVILASGVPGMPVQKLAKKVAKLLSVKGATIDMSDLLSIKGIGLVKAGQIAALFELASRFTLPKRDKSYTSYNALSELAVTISRHQQLTVLFYMFDGAMRLINEKVVPFNDDTNSDQMVRWLFASAVQVGAIAVYVVIGKKEHSLQPSLDELAVARNVHQTARLLSIKVADIHLASGTKVVSISRHRA
ncbi:MAG: UPF0758 domain-containing protein [Candidatus Microsaccharimonas sp.]